MFNLILFYSTIPLLLETGAWGDLGVWVCTLVIGIEVRVTRAA